MSYKYIGNEGDFVLENPEKTSYLYFPLANEQGVKSCVTPNLGGDLKLNQNTFFMPPVSSENLHNDKSSRNFWCEINGKDVWSLTGKSASQQAMLFSEEKEETKVEAGFMYHTLSRVSKEKNLEATITSFVPCNSDMVEVMKLVVKNTGNDSKRLKLTTAIPMYARSADNIRDHRHVTALLHRIETTQCGIVVNPTMTFDERGHQRNELHYGVFGGNEHATVDSFFPIVEEFIGEGGSLEHPQAIYAHKKGVKPGTKIDGFEALGGLAFEEEMVEPGQVLQYVVVMAYGKDSKDMETCAKKYFSIETFDTALEETKAYWKKKVNITYHTQDRDFDLWMKWVSFQPMLRRIYGCSFLPHHDYGKGGRGWRDLWQDCLALLLMEPQQVRSMLVHNFGGVRADGTNATIIGDGEFIADRNNITRVWMDHGVWPFLTTDLYIQQTGDLKLLLEETPYFKDPQVCRGEAKDTKWEAKQQTLQKDESGNVYSGTILEHLLVEHLTSFYDVGEHNHIRMRGADWNDALDMADERGESVAFTFMYAKNMENLAQLLEHLKNTGVEKVTVLKELQILLQQGQGLYDSVEDKKAQLQEYCKACMHTVSGEKISLEVQALQENLLEKAAWISKHVRETEWIDGEDGQGWYNGYYDNSGRKVEGTREDHTRMMLTSQVFAVMSQVADEKQVKEIIAAADTHLYDGEVGGYKLNTNFHEVKMDLGRMFGFAYGQKENGAVFSHMTTMYGNALYQRHCPTAAYKVINSLYKHCSTFEKSKIYPGVPEYIDGKGRGLYHYLTGAASWLLLTVVTQMFGVRGKLGDLIFDPQLRACQFDEQAKASIDLIFAGKSVKVTYHNPHGADAGKYMVKEVWVNGTNIPVEDVPGIKKQQLETMGETLDITVLLEETK